MTRTYSATLPQQPVYERPNETFSLDGFLAITMFQLMLLSVMAAVTMKCAASVYNSVKQCFKK